MEQTKKVFFRATEAESWQWRERATERKMTLDAYLREAAELYAMIPPSGLGEVRTWIAERFARRKRRDSIYDRVVMLEAPEEAETVNKILEMIRSKREPEYSLVQTLLASRAT